MEINVKILKHCALVALSGDVDHANAPTLTHELLDLIEDGVSNLVLSFRDVTYISSAGLRALVAAQTQARQESPPGKIILSELSPVSQRTFELVGFHHLFEFYETDAQAVGSF
jgi:anti-sigma B factor antagonist